MYSELIRKRFIMGGQLPSPEERPDPERYEPENKATRTELDGLGQFLTMFAKSPVMPFAAEQYGSERVVTVPFVHKTREDTMCAVQYDQLRRRINKLSVFGIEDLYNEDKKSHIEVALVYHNLRKPTVFVAFNHFARDYSFFHTSEDSQRIEAVAINQDYTATVLETLTTAAGLPTLDLVCVSNQETSGKQTGPVGRVSNIGFTYGMYSPDKVDLAHFRGTVRVRYHSESPTIMLPDGLSSINFRDILGVLHMTSRVTETPMFEVDRGPHTADQQYRFGARNLDYVGLLQNARMRVEDVLGSQLTERSSQ